LATRQAYARAAVFRRIREELADRTRSSTLRLSLATAAAVVALDAATKALAVHFLSGRGIVHVPGGAIRLELYRNFAGPRNTLPGHTVLISLAAIVAVAAFAVLAMRVRTTALAVATGLALGAGIGNLLDRLFRAPGPLRGGVVDWLRPAWSSGSMNVADVAIQAAILVLLGAVVADVLSRSHRRASAPAP
jgi:signal peptidase II